MSCAAASRGTIGDLLHAPTGLRSGPAVPPPGGAHVLVLSRKIWSFRRVAEVADVAHELKDKWDIVDVVNRYTRALDTRDWDMLAAVFTEDGGAEFDVLGIGHRPTPQAVVDFCRNAL